MGTMDTEEEHCVHKREIVVIWPDDRNHSGVPTGGQWDVYCQFGFHLLEREAHFSKLFDLNFEK